MNLKNFHFIGLGGIGMSGIARMLLAAGHSVQGSDLKKTEILEELEALGARVFIGHDAANVRGASVVVYSSSIRENHPERLEAVKNHIPLMHRSQALAELCRGKFTIAVTGTHGKTTTTALIGMVLREAGRDPSIVIGGLVKAFGGNAVYGTGPEIVIEADESDSSFLNFSPAIEVITNIEAEHMDHFQTLDDVDEAYRRFIRRLPADGEWLGCGDDDGVLRLARTGDRKYTLYGLNEDEGKGIYATDIEECPNGVRGIAFRVWVNGDCFGSVSMKIIGRHNALNALAAIGVGLRLGIAFEVIARALGKYEGVGRRFDVKYEDADFLIVDDYAHHPTEIQSTLAAAKSLNRKRIVAIFQPHRYSRTEALLAEFAKSFGVADKLILTDIYAASEEPRPGITGNRVLTAVKDSGHPDAVFVKRPRVTEYLREEIRPGDLLIALGAGDIYHVAGEISEYLHGKKGTAPFFLEKNLEKRALSPFSVRGLVKPGELLSKHTSLKIGGAVDFWIEPADAEDLRTVIEICQREAIPMRAFGAGSNLLPPDEGLTGAVIHLASPAFRKIRREGEFVAVGAGVANALFIQHAVEQGFGGCEFLSGIPGNIGGSIAMNAGSHQQSIDTLIEGVRVLDFNGREKFLTKSEIPFRYRSSGLRDLFILEGVFSLPKCDRAQTQEKLDEYRSYRQKTQDLHHASAGCMFKNPSIPGCSAGRLIEEAGLKGRRIGGAQVSEKHANFIVNLGGATAADVKQLIAEVRRTVKNKYEIELETEVKIL